MPYKLQGNCVMKKNENGKWVVEKCHPTREKAVKHLIALKINVEDA